MVSVVSYDLSGVIAGQSVVATSSVSFGYDPAGNRTSMNDGLGSVTYAYDQLSRLTSETRGLNGSSYTLSYTYNLASELTSITDQWAMVVNYSYDKIGRVSGISGSGGINPPNYASGVTYRAFGAIKGMTYGDGKTLSTLYDNRLRPTKWDVSNVLGYNYNYDYFNERTGRVTYAGSIYDPTLDRSYEYDQVGRLAISHAGAEARAHAFSGQWGTMDGPYSQGYDYDVWGNVTHKYGWGGEVQGGGAGQSSDIYYSYTGNRRNGFTYDSAGNLTNDLGQTFTYDVTGQQATATFGGYSLTQSYDGNGLRVKKNDNGPVTYYLRSSVLGGQVVAEISGAGVWTRGYVYVGSQLLAVQSNGVFWMHEDPITKSKRVTNGAGVIVSTIELDPWGADTNRSNNAAFQPRKFTSYERDGNGSDEAMFRRYNRWQSRFDQPDRYSGSYDLTNPQSFNRYAYVQGDPVNYVDPSGLMRGDPGMSCLVLIAGTHWFRGNEHVGSSISSVTLLSCMGGFSSLVFERPEPQNPRRLTQAEIKALENLLKARLKGLCQEFIDAVFKKLSPTAASVDLLYLFGDISDQSPGGFFLRFEGTPSATGNRREGVAQVALLDVGDVPILIHELFHHAGFGHDEMGKAAYSVLADQGRPDFLKNTNTPGPPREGKAKEDNYYNATLFDNAVRLICGP